MPVTGPSRTRDSSVPRNCRSTPIDPVAAQRAFRTLALTLWFRHLPSPSVVGARRWRAAPCTHPAAHGAASPLGPSQPATSFPRPSRSARHGASHAPPGNATFRRAPAARAVGLAILQAEPSMQREERDHEAHPFGVWRSVGRPGHGGRGADDWSPNDGRGGLGRVRRDLRPALRVVLGRHRPGVHGLPGAQGLRGGADLAAQRACPR